MKLIAGGVAVSRRWIAVGLALFFGVLGLHWFYLGRFRRGLLHAALGLVGLSLYVGVFDAIRWAWLSDAAFERRYGCAPVRRRRRKSRLNRVQVPIPGTVEDEVDHLRRQWQVGAYDPGGPVHEPQSGEGFHDASAINPATGLPMLGGIGGFDTSGHSFGTGFEHDHQMGWPVDDAYAHARSDDRSFNAWEP
ncbi:TM2 domain-containing protein [Hydrocarboniphaga effusa]|uniref:TM2 domain-containing protein n=1 Tax=Hydrocarboniphaga effusa TaxID=243629 RepID=UPI00398C1340